MSRCIPAISQYFTSETFLSVNKGVLPNSPLPAKLVFILETPSVKIPEPVMHDFLLFCLNSSDPKFTGNTFNQNVCTDMHQHNDSQELKLVL